MGESNMDGYVNVEVTVHDLTSTGVENAEKIVKLALKFGIEAILKDAGLCKKYGIELRPEFVVRRLHNRMD